MADQTGSSAQREQQRLVEEALKEPGVAEAVEVFNAASRHVPRPTIAPSSGVGYATGGNQH